MINISLANRALAAVGTRSTISSSTEGSVESNNVALVYDPVRQQLLRAAQWNFAKATATLALLKAAAGTPENATASPSTWSTAYPPPGWLYSYAYPADCLAARKVVGNINAATGASVFPALWTATMQPWQSTGTYFEVATDTDTAGNAVNVILSNTEFAIICYTRDIIADGVWDSLFEEAFVQALAGKLALSLTGDKALAKLRLDAANDMILRARAADGNEGPTVIDHTPDWIAQGHGGRWVVPGHFGPNWTQPYGGLFSL